MKKRNLVTSLCAGVLICSLAACKGEEKSQEAKEQNSLAAVSESVATESVVSEPEASEEEEDALKNEYFSVWFDSVEEKEDLTFITLKFRNISGNDFYKSGDLCGADEIWEWRKGYSKEKWLEYAKNPFYIHTDLEDLNEEKLASFQVEFTIDEDFNVTLKQIIEE